MYKILTLNMGSTSTKVSIYEDETLVAEQTTVMKNWQRSLCREHSCNTEKRRFWTGSPDKSSVWMS